MRLAYFINQYPKVSHIFIRREIQALEKQGCDIIRIALRSDQGELVAQVDKDEFLKTHFVLRQSVLTILKAFLICLVSKPVSFCRALILAFETGWKSDRGVLRHMAYLVEACVVSMWFKEFGIKHVHAHFGTNSATVVMLANQICGVPFSFTVHGPEEFDKPEALSLGEKIKRAAFVVAISSFGKSQLSRWVDHDLWHKLKVVHAGLDSSFIAAEVQPVGAHQRFVCVGRLCEQKGQPLLLEAFHILAKEGREFELVMAGGGPLRDELEKLIARYDLQSKVRITGWISSGQVKEELLRSRALVLPSFAEGLPSVLMEAMALGRPVVTTYVAGIPELVVHGENGWLVPAGDVAALVGALREVLDANADDLGKMGLHGRKKVLERHDIDREVAKLIPLFQASIAENSGSSLGD